jgi:cyclopropane fatty-acyl-phospholipid synthase-like methyltransferase
MIWDDTMDRSTDAVLIDMLTGAWVTQVVAAIARLGVPDLLGERQPQTCEELAAAADANPDALRRAMRTLTSLGVFHKTNEGYTLTPIGERLRSETETSMRDLFLAETDEVHRRSWQHLVDAIRSGQPQPQSVFGMPAFEYYTAHPKEGEQFGKAMRSASTMSARGVLDSCNFNDAKVILDIGGGNGSLVRAILRQYPNAEGIVFDLPYIKPQAEAAIGSDGLTGRCRFESGDFFEAVAHNADVHLLRFVLHDWDDERSLQILRNCRSALAPSGRLLVVELLIPENNEPGFAQLMDINMLVMTGGMERTAREYEQLLGRAGFQLTQVLATGSPFFVIEARSA